MDKQRRKELVEDYRRMKVYMGIFQIRNDRNGKVWIASCSNLKSRWLTMKGQLEQGRHMNLGLQRDWNELGSDAFSYEVLEEAEVKEDTDVKWELQKMEKAWLQKLEPYGEKGYHPPPRK